jgi:hypothetical protein
VDYNNYSPSGYSSGLGGWYGASFAGGTEIMISGPQFGPAETLLVMFEGSVNGNSYELPGPPPTTANAFSSDTNNGLLQYTTPGIDQLIGYTIDALKAVGSISFQIGIIDPLIQSLAHGDPTVFCVANTQAPCTLVVSTAYTPVLYYVSPRVVYNSEEIDYYVDPKSTTNLWWSGVDALPFTQATING